MRLLPNLLSAVRALLAVPVVLAIRSGAGELAFLLLLAAALTDALDGYVARRLGARTEAGRVLDPLADKLLAAAAASALWAWRGLPGWFLAVVIARDALILAAGGVLARRAGRVPESTPCGKAAFAAVAAALLAHLAPWRRLSGAAIIVAALLLLLSVLDYGRVALRVLRGPRGGSAP
jgi:cardiolipin synthase